MRFEIGFEARVLGRIDRIVFVFVIAAVLLTTSFPAGFAQANGPTEVVQIDIVDLRRSYRDGAGESTHASGAEFFAEDGNPDLEASLSYLEGLGVTPVEVYGSYVLARIDDATKTQLESLGIRVEAIPQRTKIPIGTYPFDTKTGEPPIPDFLRGQPPVGGASRDFIVQFLGPIKAGWLSRIDASGGEIKQFLGRYAAVVDLTAAGANAVRSLDFAEWVGLFHPAYKIPPRLLEATETLELDISSFSGKDLTGARSFVESHGGVILDSWEGVLQVTLDPAHLGPLAHLSSVSSVRAHTVARTTNDETTGILQSGAIGSRPIFARGIHGEDELLTMADSGIEISHEMFFDPSHATAGPNHRKVEAYEPFGRGNLSDESGHGTHVAGTYAGDRPGYNVYNLFDGHAFVARLYLRVSTSRTLARMTLQTCIHRSRSRNCLTPRATRAPSFIPTARAASSRIPPVPQVTAVAHCRPTFGFAISPIQAVRSSSCCSPPVTREK